MATSSPRRIRPVADHTMHSVSASLCEAGASPTGRRLQHRWRLRAAETRKQSGLWSALRLSAMQRRKLDLAMSSPFAFGFFARSADRSEKLPARAAYLYARVSQAADSADSIRTR